MAKADDFDRILSKTLDDGRLSRAERRALSEVLDGWSPDAELRAQLRARAFEAASERVRDPRDRQLIEWLEDVVKVLSAPVAATEPSEAFFSPGEACRDKIVELMRSARRSVDICVFTITDNVVADAILDAHRRHVKVRIITDDDKSLDRGSDIDDLQRAGITVVTDHSENHMHHKFAVFDGRVMLTGSYNWTRSAAAYNEENIVVSHDPNLCATFTREFERLWVQFH